MNLKFGYFQYKTGLGYEIGIGTNLEKKIHLTNKKKKK